MALQVNTEMETPQGINLPSTYWRWVGLGVDVSKGAATAVLYAYIDAEAFANGKENVGQRQYSITGEAFMALANDLDGENPVGLSNAIYGYVKANDELFAEAVEV